jgi:hypothetical protein
MTAAAAFYAEKYDSMIAHRLTATLLQETCDRLIAEAKTSVGVETMDGERTGGVAR